MSELLIAGGLTIDRFADGRTAPGGSVLHCGHAAVAEGVAPHLFTVAGDEPEARDGLRRLAAAGTVTHQPSPSTTTYRHDESTGRRVLIYDAASDQLDPRLAAGLASPRVALLAPIASELAASDIETLRAALRPRWTVLLIQGWLRRLEIGEPVHPLPLGALDAASWHAFGRADAVILSTEDLAEAPEDPFAQAAALRRHLGATPILVLTLGAEGYLLDDPALDRLVAAVPRRVVEGVPSVGAGDTFGAAFALRLARGASSTAAADAATDRVIAVLESRRG